MEAAGCYIDAHSSARTDCSRHAMDKGAYISTNSSLATHDDRAIVRQGCVV